MAGHSKDEFRQRRRAIGDAFRSLELDVRMKRFGLTATGLYNAESLMQAIRNRLRATGMRVE